MVGAYLDLIEHWVVNWSFTVLKLLVKPFLFVSKKTCGQNNVKIPYNSNVKDVFKLWEIHCYVVSAKLFGLREVRIRETYDVCSEF